MLTNQNCTYKISPQKKWDQTEQTMQRYLGTWKSTKKNNKPRMWNQSLRPDFDTQLIYLLWMLKSHFSSLHLSFLN